LIGLVEGTGAAIVAPSSLTQKLEDDAMKWTLLVTTCLLAFAFSQPASARQSAKEPQAGLHAKHAWASKHTGSWHNGAHGRRVAVIRPRHEAYKRAGGDYVRRHAGAKYRERPYAAVRNPSARIGPEGGAMGVATWYRHAGMTAAHKTLPFGTHVRVTNLTNGRSVVVRINDRGPYGRGKTIDVSDGAARALGMIRSGVARVRIHVI
jgi:rare lipoprotein A (peptidoglycan hydrolase)